ncbi:Itaconate transport protein, partial [Lachnellula suecica]
MGDSPLHEQTPTDISGQGQACAATSNVLPHIIPEPLYTIYNRREKLFLVCLGTMATFLSPVTANIYFPAMNVLAEDLHVSYNLINLTITTFLIFQGLAPTFVGSFSDSVGRRPAYLITFVIYLGANLGLALQNSYTALLVLRCLQSAGSSGTLALGNALVSDIATSSERGTYIGYSSMGALLGQVLGPIMGGLLNKFLGWRAIFWFLFIFSAVVLLLFLVLLPETCRAVVGNGSIPPQKWNISLLTYLKQRSLLKSSTALPPSPPPLPSKRPNLLASLKIIFSKQGSLLLLYTGFIFSGFYTITAALPAAFAKNYGFNSLQIGLCYIPFGCGSLTSAILTGKTVDWNFRRHARILGIPITKGRQTSIRHFPIEKARLQIIFPLMFAGSAFMVAYQWVVEAGTNLAGPLILLFPMGFCITGAFTVLSALMVDLWPESPGTATAASNLVRCWMSAGVVAGIGPLIAEWGNGVTGVLIAGGLGR